MPGGQVLAADGASTPRSVEPDGASGAADPQLVPGDWPSFHANPARTGTNGVRSISRPVVKWKTRVGIQSWLNSPVVMQDRIYVPSSGRVHNKSDPEDGVYALALGTGNELWHHRLPKDANGAAVTERFVFVTSDDGHLHALDRQTGREMWKRRGTGKMYSHPLLLGKTVVVVDAAGTVRCYDADTGKPQWQRALRGPVRGGAAADEHALYVATETGKATALDPSTGKLLWQAALTRISFDGREFEPAPVYSVPVLFEDLVIFPFIRDTYYRSVPALMALEKRDGSLRWRAQAEGDWSFGNIRSTPALLKGILVYAEPYSGDVVGIDARTGRMTFRQTVEFCSFPQWASPATSAELVYVPRYGGTLFAVEPTWGRSLWQLYLGDSTRIGQSLPLGSEDNCSWEAPVHALSSPTAVAGDGTLLQGSEEGYLYAIGDS